MRTVVPEAEEILDLYFPILDGGFIALKDYMGSDVDVEAAARVSYGKGTRKVSNIETLIRYLVRSQHTSPSEMCELKFHIRAPLYVLQQWLRHRTANINSASNRYSLVQDDYQITNPNEWRLQSKDNKQGSNGYISEEIGQLLSEEEEQLHDDIKRVYNKRIELGVAKEQARKDIPASSYLSIYWKCDLRNIFHFLDLRTDSHAQLEIREYANIMAAMVKRVAPICYQAWLDYSKNAKNFSALDIQLLHRVFESQNSCWELPTIPEDKRECYEAVCKYFNENPLVEGMVTNDKGVCTEYEEFWDKLIPSTFDVNLDLTKGYRKND